jgi:hypothetical protein
MFSEFRKRKTELTEYGNFRLFAASMFFLGRQAINGNLQMVQ